MSALAQVTGTPQNALADIDALADEGRHAEVIVLAEQHIATWPADANAQRMQALWLMSRSHEQLGDITAATEAMQRSLLHARAIPDTAGMLRALSQISEWMFDGNRFEESFHYYRDVFRLANAFGDQAMLRNAYNNLANRFLMTDQVDSAEHYYREGLGRVGEDDVYGRAMFETNIGKLLSERAEHDDAIVMLGDAVERMRSIDNPKLFKVVNTHAYALHNAGRHKEALAAFAESERLNQESEKDIFTTMENLGFTAEGQAALGEHESAYGTMLQLEELLHEFYARNANEELLELEKRFETRLKEEEIERLDVENREQAARIEARNVMLYGSLALVVLALAAAVLFWRNFQQKRRHADVLEQLNTELKDQKERIEEINGLLQLKVLRTQMNPHFIYNCLNAIGNLVRKGDAVAASAYLDGFARLLRMVLDHSVKDRVPISQELDFLRQYMKLESLRFPDGLHYTVDADRELIDEDVPVPTLLVQPFVENAIWHGLANKEGEKRLSVRFEEHGESLRCVVEDNGVGRKAAPPRAHSDGSPSMGLQLTNERLQLLSYKHEEQGRALHFEDLLAPDGSPAGTRVELVLG
jgi:tetratricopeptide (TPR) repeat protein